MLLSLPQYTVSSATKRHNRDLPKPNEDHVLCDTDHEIFIVLDGITRPHAEYETEQPHSASAEISRIFAEAVHRYMVMNRQTSDSPEQFLRNAVRCGNEKIAAYRSVKSKEQWGFYPGTLGIIAYISKNQLHYICAGDCFGMILRGNSKIGFGNQYAIAAVDAKKVSKQERYDIYCNHPENELSYVIFNGDEMVADNCEYSYIDLHAGDTVFLVSDGMKSYIQFEKPHILKEKSVEAMMLASERFDSAPFAKYADDKAVIKIEIQ